METVVLDKKRPSKHNCIDLILVAVMQSVIFALMSEVDTD